MGIEGLLRGIPIGLVEPHKGEHTGPLVIGARGLYDGGWGMPREQSSSLDSVQPNFGRFCSSRRIAVMEACNVFGLLVL
jgi:hypothetical protein